MQLNLCHRFTHSFTYWANSLNSIPQHILFIVSGSNKQSEWLWRERIQIQNILDSVRCSCNQPCTNFTKCLSIWFSEGIVLKLTIKQLDEQYLLLVHFFSFLLHLALEALIRNKNNLSDFCFFKWLIKGLCSQSLVMT